MSHPFTSAVRSVVPGRLRLRHPELEGLSVTDAMHLTDIILSCKGVKSCDVNPRIGSLLITWDPTVLEIGDIGALLNRSQEDMAGFLQLGKADASMVIPPEPKEKTNLALQAAQGAATTVLSSAARVIAPDAAGSKPKFAARMVQNRLMLVSLGLSLVGLATGLRLHMVMGQVFLGLLACHLYQHRRVL